MRLSKVCMRFQLTWLAAIAATAILLTACGEQVSQEEFEAVQRELETARSQLQSLETEKRELQTRLEDVAFGKIANVLRVNEKIAFPPTVVELTSNKASVQMITKVPTSCVIAHGLTTAYGQISTDDSMTPGGHTDHFHVLRDLQSDTVYHYKWGLVGPDGTVYASQDVTLRTPPSNAPNK